MGSHARVDALPTRPSSGSSEQKLAHVASALPAHLPALDGLRGVAILLVAVHMLSTLEVAHGLPAAVLSFVVVRGWVGVQLFFVLSGFLITGILLDTQSADNGLSAFFARRLLRIFPLYYLVLIVAFVILPAFGPLTPALAHDRAHQVWLWTYLSNWTLPYEAGSRAFPHFWSLAVEEQFYLVWPFLVRSRTPASCLKLCLVVALISLATRVGFVVGHLGSGAIYTFSVTRMDALALGGAAAAALRIPAIASQLFARRRQLWVASFAVAVGGAVLTRGFGQRSVVSDTVGYTFLAVCFALVTLAAAIADAAQVARLPVLRSRLLRTFGKYSYAIYVFHKPLHDFVGVPLLAHFGLDFSRSVAGTIVYVICGLAVSYAAAVVSYYIFERHFLRLKAYFVPRSGPRRTVLVEQIAEPVE
jgi:peptidoglycan/LPS O-acetylase OafA/YrhL